jgi:hypothetical protein
LAHRKYIASAFERIPKSVKRFSEEMRDAEQKLRYIDLVYSDRCISTVGAISKRLSSEPPVLFSKQRQLFGKQEML